MPAAGEGAAPAHSDRWQDIADRADLGLLRTDAHGRIVDINPAAARLLGRGIETLRGIDLPHLVEVDARPQLSAALQTMRLEHAPIALPLRFPRTHASVLSTFARLAPVCDAAGVMRAATVALLDLGDQRLPPHADEFETAMSNLRTSEERCRALFQSIDAGFCVIEVIFDGDRAVDYRFIETNPAFERLTGLQDAVGKRMREMAPAHEQHWFDLYGNVARTGKPARETLPAKQLDDRWYEVHAFPYGAPGEHRVAIMFDDITVRVRAELAVRENEERFRSVANATPSILWSASANGDTTWLSDRWTDYTGLPAEVDRDSRNAAIHPEDRPLAGEAWQRAHAGADFDVELRLRGRDGAYRWFLVRAKAKRDEAGQVTAWYGSTTDIHDHKSAEVALRDVDRRKDEFLATLAHELRNPLAPLRNCLHILRMADEADTGAAVDSERLHAVMERQVAHLVRLVDDLMEVSRITRGMVPLHLQAVTIQEVVERAVETSRPLLDAARHSLEIDVPTQPLQLRADPVRLAQVLSNLLNNAAKYTEPGGRIVLSAARQGTDVVLRVRDNGLGIAPDALDRVFDLFNQAEHSIGHAAGGLGIGLTLVRSLVALHHGTVLARSAGLGQGSEFEVRLPLQDDASMDLSDDGVLVAGATAHQRLRLLVVDDNHAHTDSLALYLRMTGHTVRTAYDAASALVWQGTFTPDAVLLDLGLPGVDGLEVCRRMRAAPGGDALVIVAITGRGQASDRDASDAAGFDAHLVKPVDPAALVTLVDSLLRVKRRSE